MAAKKKPKVKRKPAKRTKKQPAKGTKRKAPGCTFKIVIFQRADLPGQPYFVDTQKTKVSIGKGDRVFWFNSTSQPFTLTFNGDATQWPFVGPKQDVPVPAYANSAVFRAGKKGQFSYHGTPHLDGPPADPVVDAGD